MTLHTTARRRLRLITTAAIAAASLAVAGCTAQPDADVPAGEIGGKLTYWVGLDSITDEAVAAATHAYVDPFTAKFPNVDVEVVAQNGEGFEQKIRTALAAGLGPDFIETPGSATAIPYAQAGYLADLTDIAEEEGWADKMLPWALDMGVIDGKLLAIPVTYETMVMYYNKNVFAEHGWVPPTDLASLEQLAGEMEAAGMIPFSAGNADYTGATEFLVSTYLNQVAGPGKIHDALADKIPFTDQAFVDSLQMMVDHFDAGWYAGGVKQYFSATIPTVYGQLVNGKAGMYVSGSWEIYAMNEYFSDSGSDWDWAPLPPLSASAPSEVYPLSVGGTLSINSATANPAAAAEYLKWRFSDKDANWAAIKDVGDLPLPMAFDAAAAPEGIDPRFITQYTAISDASVSQNVGYVTWTSFGGAAEAYILENEDKLLTHDLSPAEFLAGVDKAFQGDFDDGIIPPLFDTSAR